MNKKDRPENKQRFLHDENIRYFVATPATGGVGLDGLQHVCSTCVYYSNSFNWEHRIQSEGRIRRDGTVHTTNYFDLFARKSPDAGIATNLKEKKDISTLFFDDYRKLLEDEES